MGKNVRVKAHRGKVTKASYKRSLVDSRTNGTTDKPCFDREVDHLPKSVVEQQVERLIRENKQALDALSKL